MIVSPHRNVRGLDNGEVMSQSAKVRDLIRADINGDRQWVLVRGENEQNPLILFLHGGPGFAQMSFAPSIHKPLEKRFLVCNWDQRASGKSISKHLDHSTLTFESYIEDTIQTSKWLLNRYGKQKLYLVGHSWGCTLGLFAVQKCPDLYEAFIGTGFGVDFQAGEQISMRYLRERAEAAKDARDIQAMDTIHFPIVAEDFENYIELKSKMMNKYGGYFYTSPLQLLFNALPRIVFSRTYRPTDYFKMIQGMKYGKELAKQVLPTLNLFRQIPELATPIYFFIGRHDYHTPFELALKYYDTVSAPTKEWVWFNNSAHSPLFEESKAFCIKLIEIADLK